MQLSVELSMWIPRRHNDKMEILAPLCSKSHVMEMNTYRLGYKQYSMSCPYYWKVVKVVGFGGVLLPLYSAGIS